MLESKLYQARKSDLIPGPGLINYPVRFSSNFRKEMMKEDGKPYELILRGLPHQAILGLYHGFIFVKLDKIYWALEQLWDNGLL